ncbi:MAG: hypothetical protein L0211_06245 [Planctomycetaceae bacterium]|nr:hypothetical protein [Planctomycetaceae bacterium]
MQRMWMRALIFVAVIAGSAFMTSEAEAQGPIRRLFRRMLGRDNVVTANTYIDANGNRVMVRDGYTYTYGRFDANGRWIPIERTTVGRVETRVDGQVAPATRIEADANVRTPGANVGGTVTGDANVDLNRGGTIRSNVEGTTRGGVTTPTEAPRTPAEAPRTNSALPPPLPNVPTP